MTMPKAYRCAIAIVFEAHSKEEADSIAGQCALLCGVVHGVTSSTEWDVEEDDEPVGEG